MRLTITDRKALRAALAECKRIARGASKSMPPLRTVRVAAAGDATFAATDLEVRVQLWVSACVAGEGERAVDAAALAAAVGKLDKKAPVTIEADGERGIAVECAGVRTTLDGIDLAELPEIPELPIGSPCGAADSTELAELLAVTYAASTDATRYNLNGVRIRKLDAVWQAEATDGHRLARVTGTLGNVDPLAEPEGAIVPKVAADAILRALGKRPTGAVFIEADARLLSVLGDRWSVQARLIEAEFPRTDQIVPSAKRSDTWYLDRDSLASALRAVEPAANPRSHAVRVTLNGSAKIEAEHEGSAASAEIEAEGPDGEAERVVGFNATYLLDALDHADAIGRIGLQVADELAPARIDTDHGDRLAIVMPMRL